MSYIYNLRKVNIISFHIQYHIVGPIARYRSFDICFPGRRF